MRLLLLPCTLLVACTCTSSQTTVEAFCVKYTDAVCARLAECRGGPADAWCERVAKVRLCAEVSASERDGRTQFHSDYVEACLGIVATTKCKFLAARSSSGELDVLCSMALSGVVSPGGMCFADRECGLDYHCDRSAARCPGTCRRLRENGESCDPLTGVKCNLALVCLGGTCGVPKKLDEACTVTPDCEAGLACDFFAPTLSCRPDRSTGPCRPGLTDCAPRAACTTDVPDAGTCAPAKQEGQPCAPGRAECNELLSCPSGTCVRWGSLGAECGELAPNERAGCLQGGCDIEFGQVRGTCVQRDAGADCELDVQCGPGGQCIGTPRVCVARCGAN